MCFHLLIAKELGSEKVEYWYVTVMEERERRSRVLEIPVGKMVHDFSYASLVFWVFLFLTKKHEGLVVVA